MVVAVVVAAVVVAVVVVVVVAARCSLFFPICSVIMKSPSQVRVCQHFGTSCQDSYAARYWPPLHLAL